MSMRSLFVLLWFLALAAIAVYLQFPATVADLGDDQHNVATFAAGNTYPSHFIRDSFLGNQDHYAFYHPALVRTVSKLEALTGSYPAAYLVFLGPALFFFMLGFYLLARLLDAKSIPAAASAAGLAFVVIPFRIGGDWAPALLHSMTAKNLFVVAVPWLMYFAIQVRARPFWWPALGLALGSAFYIHQPSAPAWGLAIWGALLRREYRYGMLRRHALPLLLMALAAITVVLPGLGAHGPVDRGHVYQPEELVGLVKDTFVRDYTDLGLALKNYFALAVQYKYLWPALALLAGIVLARRIGGRFSDRQRFLLDMMLILFASTLGAVAADQGLARLLGRPPVLMDLIRNMRFWPYFVVVLFFAFRDRLDVLRLEKLSILGWSPTMANLVGGSLMLAMLPLLSLTLSARHTRDTIMTEYGIGRAEAEAFQASTGNMVAFMRDLDLGGCPVFGPFWLRHAAKVAVIHSRKEGGALLYSGSFEEVKRWEKKDKAVRAVLGSGRSKPEKEAELLALARKWGACAAVLRTEATGEATRSPATDTLFRDTYWKVVKVGNNPPSYE